MRSLKLNDVARGIGIRVYCNQCGTWFDPRLEDQKNRKNQCSHPVSKQRYKSTIIAPSGFFRKRKRRSRVFDTRDLDEVISQGLAFKQHVRNSIQNEVTIEKKKQKPMLLIDCLAMFLDFVSDVDVLAFEQKSLSANTLASYKNYITKWKEATDLIGEDFTQLRVDKISDENKNSLFMYLTKYSKSTQKKAFGLFNQFYRYLNENGYGIQSPFKRIKISDEVNREPRALTHDEFELIKSTIAKGSKDDKLYGKSIHFDWVNDALDFAALTGRRREEFMNAKFSDIVLLDGNLLGSYITMVDDKYSKQRSNEASATTKNTKAPIFPELYDFLMKMGYEQYKNTDRYIVAGDETKQRDTLANNLTNCFGYYRPIAGLDDKIQLKGLRKKYVTRMRNEFGNNASFFTGHADSRIDKIHYYDDKEIFEKIVEFVLWKKPKGSLITM